MTRADSKHAAATTEIVGRSCVSENEAVDLIAGQLDEHTRAAIDRHLDACAPCRRLISGLARFAYDASGFDPSFAAATTLVAGECPSSLGDGSLDSAAESVPAGLCILAPGRTLGRYVILEPIGAGGMGIVYAAYDPRLKRRIALKLVRVANASAEGGHVTRLRERLVREAEAMAQLSHPNVMTVYDAGADGDDVFIAMEMIEGATLRGWLAERPRRWRDVRAVFVAAGRGLAAAHAAGLVHRDFKPDNVLIGHDGRVSVSDFGLACAADSTSSEDGTGIRATRTSADGAVAISGALRGCQVGTPAYMAPEQRGNGGRADARGDQYSFCVALQEAVGGTRPDGLTGPATSVFRGGRIPNRLRNVVGRGTSLDPERRFPSMTALLAALEPIGAGRRAPFVAIAGGVVVTLAIALGLAMSTRSDAVAARCTGAREQLEGVWGVTRKQAVKAAVLAHPVTYAQTTWGSVERTLDGYAGRWMAMHREACEATSVRHEQPDSVLALRMSCLEQRRQELDQATEILAAATTPIDRAVQVASAVPAVSRCADLPALAAIVPPPSEPRIAVQVADVRRRLASAKALGDAGLAAASGAVASALLDEARSLGYAPLLAQVYYRIAVAGVNAGHAADSERALEQAILAAEAGRDDELVAVATSTEVMVVGYFEGRHADGDRLIARSEAAIARLATISPKLAFDARGRLIASESSLAFGRGDQVRAVALGEDAIRYCAQTFGANGPEAARLEMNLASTLETIGRYEDALALYARASEILRATEGPGHPDLLGLESSSALLLDNMGRTDEAATQLERVLAAAETTLGPHHRTVMLALERLAAARLEQHRGAESLTLIDRALAVRASLPSSPPVEQINALSARAAALLQVGRRREAEAASRGVISQAERTLGPTSQTLVPPLEGLARIVINRGQVRAGAALFERALAIADRPDGDPYRAANIRIKLATVLASIGQQSRAMTLARSARAAMAGKQGGERILAEIGRFFAAHSGG